MNRSERRNKIRKWKKKYASLIKTVYAIHEEGYDYLAEGDKVRLKYDYITSREGYATKSEKYKQFIEDNKDKIFTVEYDANHLDNPIIVALKEDDSEPKWLFWEEFLERVESD